MVGDRPRAAIRRIITSLNQSRCEGGVVSVTSALTFSSLAHREGDGLRDVSNDFFDESET